MSGKSGVTYWHASGTIIKIIVLRSDKHMRSMNHFEKQVKVERAQTSRCKSWRDEFKAKHNAEREQLEQELQRVREETRARRVNCIGKHNPSKGYAPSENLTLQDGAGDPLTTKCQAPRARARRAPLCEGTLYNKGEECVANVWDKARWSEVEHGRKR